MIENAKITGTMLGKEDHGIFTCQICVEGGGWGCYYGGWALDTYDKAADKRVGTAVGLSAIMELLDTLEVDEWEQLKGQYVRVETTELGGRITKIGHLLKDKWFSFEEFFANYKEVNNNGKQTN